MADPGFRSGESWKTGSAGKRERMVVYLDWLLAPAGERTPSTKTELAALLGVTPATLRNYTQDGWLQRELSSRARATARVERLPDILQSLYDQAVDVSNPRSVAAAKTYLDYLSKTEELGDGLDLESMSSEELAQVVNKLLARQASAD